MVLIGRCRLCGGAAGEKKKLEEGAPGSKYGLIALSQ